jgi:hypothetical protein
MWPSDQFEFETPELSKITSRGKGVYHRNFIIAVLSSHHSPRLFLDFSVWLCAGSAIKIKLFNVKYILQLEIRQKVSLTFRSI